MSTAPLNATAQGRLGGRARGRDSGHRLTPPHTINRYIGAQFDHRWTVAGSVVPWSGLTQVLQHSVSCAWVTVCRAMPHAANAAGCGLARVRIEGPHQHYYVRWVHARREVATSLLHSDAAAGWVSLPTPAVPSSPPSSLRRRWRVRTGRLAALMLAARRDASGRRRLRRPPHQRHPARRQRVHQGVATRGRNCVEPLNVPG